MAKNKKAPKKSLTTAPLAKAVNKQRKITQELLQQRETFGRMETVRMAHRLDADRRTALAEADRIAGRLGTLPRNMAADVVRGLTKREADLRNMFP